jgi:hypothetical protein
VTCRVTHGSASWKPGRCRTTGSSQWRRPSSTSMPSAAAVIAFVVEATPKSVCSSTRPGSPSRRTPKPRAYTTESSLTMASRSRRSVGGSRSELSQPARRRGCGAVVDVASASGSAPWTAEHCATPNSSVPERPIVTIAAGGCFGEDDQVEDRPGQGGAVEDERVRLHPRAARPREPLHPRHQRPAPRLLERRAEDVQAERPVDATAARGQDEGIDARRQAARRDKH